MKNVATIALIASLSCMAKLYAQQYTFEKLGKPLQAQSASVACVTGGSRPMAWTTVESPDFYGVVGIEILTGKSVRFDLEKYGRSHIRIHRSMKGDVYLFYGRPAHFLKYDVARNELIDLGQAPDDGYYTLRQGIGPDGKMWVGSFPNSELSWVDTYTDKIGSFGRIAEDPKEQYLIQALVSDDNWVYCAVGLHHAELWAVHGVTGRKKQILPAELMRKQGHVYLYLGADGHVYGANEGKTWRCRPDGIDFVERLPPQRRQNEVNIYEGERFQFINGNGELIAKSIYTHAERRIRTDFAMPYKSIYCLGPVVDGKIYGGGASGRATLFTYDLATGELKDLGVSGAGKVQIYDVIGHQRGIFLTTYTLGGIDLYDPLLAKVTPVIELAEEYQQERLTQLCIGADNKVYTASMPVKGILGGALARVDPNDLSVKVWRNIIPEQSLTSVVSVPHTQELFFASSIRGGSSAIPTQEEAFVGLWDIKKEKLAWQGKPVQGNKGYGQASIDNKGLIYGLAGENYYVFNPANRKVVKVDKLPVSQTRPYAFHDKAAGPRNLIYGLGDDAIFIIDPKTKKSRIMARHESIKNAMGILVTPDGAVYYGSGADLWRARPVK